MSGEIDLTGEGGPEEPESQPGAGSSAKKKPSRGRAGGASSTSKKTPNEGELKKRIGDGLEELVELIGKGNPALADTIRDDAGRMAEVLASHAVKRVPLARAIVWVFGKDSALATARAFGPTLRDLATTMRMRREERAIERLEAEQAAEPPPRSAAPPGTREVRPGVFVPVDEAGDGPAQG